jgi:hypothetical protein
MLGIEGMYLNIIKSIYDKPITNIMLNGGETETISFKAQYETMVSFPLLFNIVLKFLARTIRQRMK